MGRLREALEVQSAFFCGCSVGLALRARLTASQSYLILHDQSYLFPILENSLAQSLRIVGFVNCGGFYTQLNTWEAPMARTRQQYEADLADQRYRAEQAAARHKAQAEMRARQARADEYSQKERARQESFQRSQERIWNQAARRKRNYDRVSIGGGSVGSSTGGTIFWFALIGAALAIFFLHDGASWPVHAVEGAIAGGGGAIALALTFIVLGFALKLLGILIKFGVFIFLGYLVLRFTGFVH
jgi:hypothetical protein